MNGGRAHFDAITKGVREFEHLPMLVVLDVIKTILLMYCELNLKKVMMLGKPRSNSFTTVFFFVLTHAIEQEPKKPGGKGNGER